MGLVPCRPRIPTRPDGVLTKAGIGGCKKFGDRARSGDRRGCCRAGLSAMSLASCTTAGRGCYRERLTILPTVNSFLCICVYDIIPFLSYACTYDLFALKYVHIVCVISKRGDICTWLCFGCGAGKRTGIGATGRNGRGSIAFGAAEAATGDMTDFSAVAKLAGGVCCCDLLTGGDGVVGLLLLLLAPTPGKEKKNA